MILYVRRKKPRDPGADSELFIQPAQIGSLCMGVRHAQHCGLRERQGVQCPFAEP